jgi:hypothetical protein
MIALRRLLALAPATVAALLTLVLLRTHGPAWRDEAATAAHLVPHLRHLDARIDAGAADAMQQVFPEGHAFTHALVALTWLDLADRDPALRAHAHRRALLAYEALQSPTGTRPFPRDQQPPHGVFHAAWSLQILARAHRLDGNGVDVADLTARCTQLRDALAAGLWLEAYPGQAWPVDSVVGASALVHCTRALRDPTFEQAAQDWARRAREAAEVLPHEAGGPPRATSLALALRFLPDVDPAWSRTLYHRFRTDFMTTRAGWPAVQEHADGRGGLGDIDSGPLPLGISVAATVVGAGVARSMGDGPFADAVFGVGEGIAMALPTRHGWTWALGALPVGEAFVAWSQAAPDPAPHGGHGPPRWWRPLYEGLGWSAVLFLLLVTRSLWRRPRGRRAAAAP